MRRLAAPLLIFALALPAAAADRVVLDNGLTVLLAPRPAGDAVAVRAFVAAGRIHEPDRLAGVTHFLEHLLFRSTARRPAGEVERDLWRVGGRTGAFTAEDFAEYGALVPASALDLALDVLSDAVMNPRLSEEDVERERRVVLDEIGRSRSIPAYAAVEALRALALRPDPRGEPIFGTPASVARIRRDDLSAWHRACYRPSRTTVVLAGAFEPEAALARVRHWFGPWRPSPDPEPPPPPLPPEGFGRLQEQVLALPGASPAVYLSVLLPGYLHPDYLPLRALKEVLAGLVAQRLVLDTRAALSADTWFYPGAGRNLLVVRLTLHSPAEAATARDTLLALLSAIAGPGHPLHGVGEAASYLRAREVLLAEDPEELARAVGRAAMHGYYRPEGLPEPLAGPARYDFTTETVSAAAARWLVPANLRILFVLPPASPLPAPPPTAPAAAAAAGFGPPPAPDRIPPPPEPGAAPSRPPSERDADAVVTRLPSGLTLVHLERPGLPVVSAALAFPAGSRHASAEEAGLAALTARTVSASATEGGDDLRWRLFAAGNSWSVSTDRDLSVFSLTVPREDFEAALAALGALARPDSITESAFVEARGTLLRDARASAERPSSFALGAFRHELTGRVEPVGLEETIARLDLAQVARWHRDRYRVADAVLAVVGDIAPRRTRDLAGDLYPGDADGGAPPGRPPPDGPPLPREISRSHPSGRGYVVVGGRVPAPGGDFEAEVCVLSLALGWRAFAEFTKGDSTAYEAGAALDALAADGTLALYAGVDAARVAEAARTLLGFVAEAREPGLDPRLVEDARGAWLGGVSVASSRSLPVALRLARRVAAGLPLSSFDDLRARVASATAADVREAASALLAPDRLLVLTVGP